MISVLFSVSDVWLMPPITTPKKGDDKIEQLKQELSAMYGLQLPPREPTWSPSKRNPSAMEDKIHNLIRFLYYKGSEGREDEVQPLNRAVAEFEQYAPTIISQWRFKPAAEVDVLPIRRESGAIQDNFLRKVPTLNDAGRQALLECLYQKLVRVADLTKEKHAQSHTPKLATSIEQAATMLPNPIFTDAAPRNLGKTPRSAAKAQAKLTQYYRSKSAPNPPSSSEEFSDFDHVDVDKLLKDVQNDIESTKPVSKASLEAQGNKSTENSPQTQYHTPPTTPAIQPSFSLPLNEGLMKPPLEFPAQRKRPLDDPLVTHGPRKISREGTRRNASDGLNRSLSDTFLNNTPSSSFRTDTTKTSFSTVSSSTYTSPNTSFSSAYSGGSRKTSFDSSSDTDAMLRALQHPLVSTNDLDPTKARQHESQAANMCTSGEKANVQAASIDAKSEKVILDHLRASSPFSMSYQVSYTPPC